MCKRIKITNVGYIRGCLYTLKVALIKDDYVEFILLHLCLSFDMAKTYCSLARKLTRLKN